MDIRKKIIGALSESFSPVEYVRLEDEGKITGFVVSPRFQGISSFDRQSMIEKALHSASARLSPKDLHRVLMIAALTPAEYNTVGARVRVHKVKQMGGGAVEVRVHGARSDAEYVRGILNNQKGIQTSEPTQSRGAAGILMSFKAQRTTTDPLAKDEVIRLLNADQYVEVMPNA